jgi:glyoxylase I family protein
MSLKIGGFTPLLQVFDMPSSLAFYRDVLGFQVLSDVPEDNRCDWVMLRLHESELMLNTAYESDERPSEPDSDRVRTHRDVTLYFDCEDADAAYDYFREQNIEAKKPSIAPYGMKQVYLTDPDGYEICLQHPVRAA